MTRLKGLARLERDWLAYKKPRVRTSTWLSYVTGAVTMGRLLAAGAKRIGQSPPLLVSDLTLELLHAAVASALDAAHPLKHGTINRLVGQLGQMLNWGVEQGRIAENPIAVWRRLSQSDKRVRVPITDGEEAALYKAASPLLRDAMTVALATGLRRGELANMCFSHVDFAGRVLVVPVMDGNKCSRERPIPLSDEAMAVLRRLKEQAGSRERVFAVPNGDSAYDAIRVALCGVVRDKQAGVREDIDFHTLRVTFASRALSRGAAPVAVQELLGHASLGMLRHYTHAFRDDLTSAVALASKGVGHALHHSLEAL